MSDDIPATLSDTERARLKAEFDFEIGKALKNCEEGRVVDAEEAFAAMWAAFHEAKAKRAA